jgi:hypothetical protein
MTFAAFAGMQNRPHASIIVLRSQSVGAPVGGFRLAFESVRNGKFRKLAGEFCGIGYPHPVNANGGVDAVAGTPHGLLAQRAACGEGKDQVAFVVPCAGVGPIQLGVGA